MKVRMHKRADRQRGVAMLLAMVVLASLLLGGTIGVWMRVVHTRTSGQAVVAARALSCAEAGLAAAREYLLLPGQLGRWNLLLAAAPPLPLGSTSYAVRISNNAIEFPLWNAPPFINSPIDRDGLVVLSSTCIDATLNTPITVTRLMRHPASTAPSVVPATGGGTPAP